MAHSVRQLRYSTVADFELLIEGQSVDVSQVAADFVILATAQSLPSVEAELVIRVEGEELRRQIRLPDGASASDPIVRIERL